MHGGGVETCLCLSRALEYMFEGCWGGFLGGGVQRLFKGWLLKHERCMLTEL